MVGQEPDGRPAVFLDRDGVIVVPEFRDGRSFAPKSLDSYAFYPEARESLDRLKAAGYLLIVVTNQPDVGNGLVSQEVVDEMHRRLAAALPVDDIRVCTHRQDENCACRKPKPGMLTDAADQFRISIPRSFMVGDRASDVEAGRLAGCRTVFVDLDYDEPRPEDATFTVRSLRDATNAILGVTPHLRGMR